MTTLMESQVYVHYIIILDKELLHHQVFYKWTEAEGLVSLVTNGHERITAGVNGSTSCGVRVASILISSWSSHYGSDCVLD